MPRYLFLKTLETLERGGRSMPRRKPRDKGGRPCRDTPFVVTSLMAALARGDSLEMASSGVMGGMPSQR
jgi:hypothetical protein